MRISTKVVSLILSVASVAAAQSRSLVDSVMVLNRAGQWEQAGKLAEAGMRTTSDLEERCALFVGGLYALARTSQVVNGPRALKSFDDMCGKTAAASRSARELEGIRRDLALPPM